MSIWLAGLLALAAITVTYLSCVRPHMGKRGCSATASPQPDAVLNRQVADLREELRVLRAQDWVDRGGAHHSTPTPPTEA